LQGAKSDSSRHNVCEQEAVTAAEATGLTGHHGKDVCALGVVPKVEPPNAIKALAHVRLHCLHILGLRKDLQQLIIRQEIEPAASTHGIILGAVTVS
jgi:hypothetical protein